MAKSGKSKTTAQPEPEQQPAAEIPTTEPIAIAEPEAESEPAIEDAIEAESPPEIPVIKEPVTPRAPAPKRGGFWPTVLGGAVSVGLGAGAMAYFMPEGWRPVKATFDSTEIDAALAAQATRIAELEARNAELQALTAEAGALKSGLSDISAQVAAARDAAGADIATAREGLAALAEQQSAVEARLISLEKRPVVGGAASDTAIAAFEREMSDMRALLEENRTKSLAATEYISAAAAEAEAKIAAAQEEAARLKAEAEKEARRGVLLAGLSHLEAAFAAGALLEPALAEIAGAGHPIPEGLSERALAAPSLTKLQQTFPEAARAALAATRATAAQDAGTADRVMAFLQSQTGVRSLEPREGADPDAVLSRAEAALREGNLAVVFAELDGLPEEGRAALEPWLTTARARVSGADAIAELAQSVE